MPGPPFRKVVQVTDFRQCVRTWATITRCADNAIAVLHPGTAGSARIGRPDRDELQSACPARGASVRVPCRPRSPGHRRVERIDGRIPPAFLEANRDDDTALKQIVDILEYGMFKEPRR